MACDTDISPERFESHLHWLSRWHRVVRAEETLGDWDHSGADDVAITFDDGLRDNLIVALPLLEKYNFPLTVFVSAGLVGQPSYFSADELREMARHPLVTIGSQGLWRRNFTLLSDDEALYELRESRSQLKAITGRKVDLMAWPEGECDERLEILSEKCGYRAAWSRWKGTNSNHSRRRVALGRNDNLARFIVKVSGAYLPGKLLQKQLNRVRTAPAITQLAESV